MSGWGTVLQVDHRKTQFRQKESGSSVYTERVQYTTAAMFAWKTQARLDEIDDSSIFLLRNHPVIDAQIFTTSKTRNIRD
jgi:hypothetical protein